MKCSKCNSNESIFSIFVSPNKTEYICHECAVSETPISSELNEIDDQIKKYEKVSLEFGEIVEVFKKQNTLASLPPGASEELLSMGATPESPLKAAQLMLRKLKLKREEILNAMDTKERLSYKLREAITAEDYEEASRIQAKLNKL